MNDRVHPTLLPFLNWIGQPQTAHIIGRDTEGTGLSAVHTPRCSCGWKGRPVSESCDFMSTELANQENQHRMSLCDVQDLRESGAV